MAAGNVSFSALVTTTLQNHRPKLIENLMGHNALLWQLDKLGMKSEEAGSRSIVQPLLYATNDTVKSFVQWDLLDVSPQEGITASEYEWKLLAGSVSISGDDEFKNSGSKTKVISLLETKIKQLDLSFRLTVNSQLFGDGTGNSGKDITGLALAVEDGAAWSTYGGIDSSDSLNSWWRNQYMAFDTFTGGTNVFGTAGGGSIWGLAAMRRMYNNCARNSSPPGVIVTTQEIYEAYEAYMEGTKQRIPISGSAAKMMADAGFDTLEFKGKPLVFDEDCPSETMYFLNPQFLKFVVGTGLNFKETPFQTPHQQFGRVSHVLLAANIVCSKRDQQGVITDLTPV